MCWWPRGFRSLFTWRRPRGSPKASCKGVVSCKGVTDQTFSADSSIIVCPAEKTVSQLMMKMFDKFQTFPNHYHCCEADVSWWCQLMSAPDKTIKTSSSWKFYTFFHTHEMNTLFNFNNTFLRSHLIHDNLGPNGVLSPFISIDKEGKLLPKVKTKKVK